MDSATVHHKGACLAKLPPWLVTRQQQTREEKRRGEPSLPLALGKSERGRVLCVCVVQAGFNGGNSQSKEAGGQGWCIFCPTELIFNAFHTGPGDKKSLAIHSSEVTTTNILKFLFFCTVQMLSNCCSNQERYKKTSN